jgi:hypothetical protein
MLIPGESPAVLSAVETSTTPAAQKQRVTVIIKRSFGVSYCLAWSRLLPSLLLSATAGHRLWSGWQLGDRASEGQDKATTVPELRREEQWRYADRKTARNRIRYFF